MAVCVFPGWVACQSAFSGLERRRLPWLLLTANRALVRLGLLGRGRAGFSLLRDVPSLRLARRRASSRSCLGRTYRCGPSPTWNAACVDRHRIRQAVA